MQRHRRLSAQRGDAFGGAHGAFCWGVLDALLEAQAFHLVAASGASAGAMNAVVLAHGLTAGGADGARAADLGDGLAALEKSRAAARKATDAAGQRG